MDWTKAPLIIRTFDWKRPIDAAQIQLDNDHTHYTALHEAEIAAKDKRIAELTKALSESVALVAILKEKSCNWDSGLANCATQFATAFAKKANRVMELEAELKEMTTGFNAALETVTEVARDKCKAEAELKAACESLKEEVEHRCGVEAQLAELKRRVLEADKNANEGLYLHLEPKLHTLARQIREAK